MAIVLARVIGSDSTGRQTAVDRPILLGDRRAGGQRGPRVEGAQVAVVGQRLVAGARVGRGPLDRDVRVLGHVDRVEAAVLGRLGEGGGRDAAVGGEEDDAVAHGRSLGHQLEQVLVMSRGQTELVPSRPAVTALDLTADVVTLTRAAGRHRVGQPPRAGDHRRGRGRAEGLRPPHRDPARAHGRRPHRPRPRRARGHRRPPRHRAGQRQPAQPPRGAPRVTSCTGSAPAT